MRGRGPAIAAGRGRLGGAVAGCARALAGNPATVMFARNARQLRTFTTDGVPELFDMATGRSIGTFKSHIRPVTAVAFSRDGTRFVASSYECCGNSTLHLWDAKTGRQLRTLDERGTHVTSVALSGDGTLVLAGGGLTGVGKSLRLWDAATGELRQTSAEPPRLGGSYWAYACRILRRTAPASRRAAATKISSSCGRWRPAACCGPLRRPPGRLRSRPMGRGSCPALGSRRTTGSSCGTWRAAPCCVRSTRRTPAESTRSRCRRRERARSRATRMGVATVWDVAADVPAGRARWARRRDLLGRILA